MSGAALAALAAFFLAPLPPLAVNAMIRIAASPIAIFAPERPGFRPAARAVDNWRFEAGAALDVEGGALGIFAVKAESLPRCVRLNNYWCIKRAGWAGEIAADSEGHVAFASAREGAIVAALLLRRYYVDYGRRDARTIVSYWAPAQCGLVAASAGKRRSASADGLTTRGLRNTLRAKYLASRGGKARRALPKSRVAARPLPMMRAPAIAIGLGETAPASSAIRLASLEPMRGERVASDAAPAPVSCGDEGQRLANYAARIVAVLTRDGAPVGPTDDLKLFDERGEPTPALAAVMANMAAVEIGPWRVTQDLVAARRLEAERAKLEKERAAPPRP